MDGRTTDKPTMKLRFIKGWKSYVVGDVAGFQSPETGMLIERGYAVPLDGSQPVAIGEVRLPQQNKIPHLCAICGYEGKDDDGLKEHKQDKHGL